MVGTARTAFVVGALFVAACGGGTVDDAGSRGSDAESSRDGTDQGAADSSRDDDEPAAGGNGASDDEDTGTDDGLPAGSTPGSGGAESVMLEPPPDPDDLDPADDPPDQRWELFRTFASVSVGGQGYDFIGVGPIWFTDMSPSFQPLDPDGEPLIMVSGCSILQSSDNQVIATASFHHPNDRFNHDSFSIADRGDGTVNWGLFDAASGEEWSATGRGAATIEYLRGESRDDAPWDLLGFDDDTEELYVLIEFAGEATENFSTDKSQASSRVLCHYLERPD